MLKVHRLEISGFKSFVDPVRVEFAGGITAIVGPNGCGKSNLSEAMTWVLGEQSAKSLRGGTMEDVIFNGSEARKPLGLAECTLTLRTPPSHPGAQEGIITLGRRVFRGGESQYRLNGKIVRLKEIKDLLMDTGLGLRAYSVIEQGKIGMILSGKPLERRKLLEEAAGITRYKARKSVAEVKLQEAMANLLRLDDIVSEVDRAVKSLKRQASAARRYQEKEVEYKVLLELVLLGRYGAVAARLAALKGRIEEGSSREAGLAADLHRDEAALAALRGELDDLARGLAERHQTAAELGGTIEGRQEFLKSNRGTVAELAERAAQDRALAERREQEVESHTETLELLEERRAELAAERTQAADAVTADETQIAAAERDVRQSTARVESLRAGLLTALDGTNAAKQRVQQTQLEIERGSFRKSHLETELARHEREKKAAADTLTQAVDKVAGLETALAGKSEEQKRVAGTLELVMRRESEAVEEKRRLEGVLSETRQRRKILAELARVHAEKRSALQKALKEIGYAAPSYLADRARAAAGWERSLDIYLGRLADAVVLPEDESALYLARALAGRAEAVLVEPAGAPAETAEIAAAWPRVDDLAVVLALGEALSLPASLALALPPAFLVETGEDAERLARRHPGVAFLSREGVWAQAGTFHVEGERATPGILERESELARLVARIPELEAELKAADATVERLVGERAALAKEANRLQNETQQLRQELAVGTARRDDAALRHRRLEAEGETLRNERDQVAREIERIEERRQILLGEVAAAEANHAGLEESFARAQAELESAQGAREGLRTESASRRGRLELLDERLESHERELARLRGEVERGKKQAEAWREEAERLTRRREELEAALLQAETDLQEALERKAAIEDGLLGEQERLDSRRNEVRRLEEGIQVHRKRREEVRGEIEELRIAHAGLRQDAEHIATSFTEAFERPLPEDLGEAPQNLAEQEAELARTKAALERLGPVNLLAVAEHDEQEERHQFLTVQRADVADSVESLKKTIKEINEASSERFRETFGEVNKAFGETFARLFRGGEAEMHLLDESDPLESGIEIVARPPGKRLQNLMLLSGGEKALTAIALLFALFRTKPSPFCILDEVDAPLDDVNTVRFVDLIKDLAAETQFIVVTHNKLTMEAAGSLYGVTMEEKGVSKLVAVKIDDVQPEPVRATA